MKNVSISFMFSLLLLAQPISAKNESKTLASPEVAATPSKWFSWFKSLRKPNRQDVRRAQAYVNSKWRCLRHGENCSKKERAALSLLAAATAALIGKGIHSVATRAPQAGSITSIISIKDIQNIARPKNWNKWDNYNGDFITFSDFGLIGPRAEGVRYGVEARGPFFAKSSVSKGFAEHDHLDTLDRHEFRDYAFVATYIIKNKKSNDYIKAQVGYPTKAQAEKFIQNMDLYVLEKLGFNAEYDIGKSVDERLFLKTSLYPKMKSCRRKGLRLAAPHRMPVRGGSNAKHILFKA